MPRAQAKGKKTAREKDLERVLAETHATGVGSDREHGPFAIEECLILMDMLDPQAQGSGMAASPMMMTNPLKAYRDDKNRQRDVDDETWATGLRMEITFRALLGWAITIAEIKTPLAGASRSWFRNHGIRTKTVKQDGETHYHCVFCDENLATLATRGGAMPNVVMDRFVAHVELCAMRFLRDVVLTAHAEAKRLPAKSFVLEHDQEVSP